MKMKQKVFKTSALALLCGSLLLPAGNALAAPSSREMQAMRAEIESLKRQNEALLERLERMEQGVANQDARIQAQEQQLAAQKEEAKEGEGKSILHEIGERLTIHGTIDSDLRFRGGISGEDGVLYARDSNEIAIDAVELEIGAQLTDWAQATVIFKWEDDSFFVDEVYTVLGGTETWPLFLKVGKYVTPFGDFTTNMLQDPFTQVLGELNEGAATIGYTKDGFTAAAFVYNGFDKFKDGETKHRINGVGAAVRYDYEEEDGLKASVGAGIVSNLASSSAISDYFADELEQESTPDLVPGLNLHGSVGYGGFAALVEYTTALDDFSGVRDSEGELTDLNGMRPAALNGELAYTADLSGFETTFALGLQKTWESAILGLPEWRYSAAVGVGLTEGLTLTMEYFRDKDYDEADNGTDDNGYGFTTRLSYEF